LKLKALVLVKFLQDEMVEPMESQVFLFYAIIFLENSFFEKNILKVVRIL